MTPVPARRSVSFAFSRCCGATPRATPRARRPDSSRRVQPHPRRLPLAPGDLQPPCPPRSRSAGRGSGRCNPRRRRRTAHSHGEGAHQAPCRRQTSTGRCETLAPPPQPGRSGQPRKPSPRSLPDWRATKSKRSPQALWPGSGPPHPAARSG